MAAAASPAPALGPMLARAAAERAPGASIRSVLFAGGRGAASIIEAFLEHSEIELTVLINAYDDGLSTGRMRRFIPGMLGPSDVRKNLARLMPDTEEHRALAELSDFRLEPETPFARGMGILASLARGSSRELPDRVRSAFERNSAENRAALALYCRHFGDYAEARAGLGDLFDFGDCALGNIFFAGCYLWSGRSFNRAIAEFARLHQPRARLLNVSRGENLFLVAREQDGDRLIGEAELVVKSNGTRIEDLLLVGEDCFRERIEAGATMTRAEMEELSRLQARTPEIAPEAEAALADAHLIVYGPGTQHSSLLPSYMTRGLAEAIAANAAAHKVFIGNIKRDFDIPREEASELATKLLYFLTRRGERPLEMHQAVTHFLLQRPDSGSAASDYLPVRAKKLRYRNCSLRLRDWRNAAGEHDGRRVLGELRAIVREKPGPVWAVRYSRVSIICPVLNERPTVAQTIEQLKALDLGILGLTTELIVVDGGSDDGTLDVLNGFDGIQLIRLNKARGRGEALRRGLAAATGDIVAFFPADLEYDAEDVGRLIWPLLGGEYGAVFGTRLVKCTDLGGRLREVYADQRVLYVLSKYGGMFLSILTLLLHNRYVSDPLTSVKVFDGDLLRSLDLTSDGVDLDTEIVAKLCRRRQYILELPVSYCARTRAAGKKMSPLDGIQAIMPLLRHKFKFTEA